MMLGRSKTPKEGPITVPDKVQRRAAMALRTGDPGVWVDQTLYLIGSNVSNHRRGDPLLKDAVQAAQSLLALLVEMDRSEEGFQL